MHVVITVSAYQPGSSSPDKIHLIYPYIEGGKTHFWCSSLLRVAFMLLEALGDIWLPRDRISREFPLIEKVVFNN